MSCDCPCPVETLQSKLDNATSEFYGGGCDFILTGIPRLANEGDACYLIRAMAQEGRDNAGSIGATGNTGDAGRTAYCKVATLFARPAVGSSFSFQVLVNNFIREGQLIFIATMGWATVTGVSGLTITATYYSGIPSPASSVIADSLVFLSGAAGAATPGDKGEKGYRGPRGPAGSIGPAGVTGPVGPTGDAGGSYSEVFGVQVLQNFAPTIGDAGTFFTFSGTGNTSYTLVQPAASTPASVVDATLSLPVEGTYLIEAHLVFVGAGENPIVSIRFNPTLWTSLGGTTELTNIKLSAPTGQGVAVRMKALLSFPIALPPDVELQVKAKDAASDDWAILGNQSWLAYHKIGPP